MADKKVTQLTQVTTLPDTARIYAVDLTRAVNDQDVQIDKSDLVSGATVEGLEFNNNTNAIFLNNVVGNNYNVTAPSANTNTTFNLGSMVINGFAIIKINIATTPTFPAGVTQEGGIAFEANTDIYLTIWSKGTSHQETVYRFESLLVDSGVTVEGDRATITNVIPITNIAGSNYNFNTANGETAYTVTRNSVINQYAQVFINTLTEPTLTLGGVTFTEVGGIGWTASTDLYLYVRDLGVDGIHYAFLPKAVGSGGGGGTISGSITDNQVAIGAATADSIEGSADMTYDSTTKTLTLGTDGTAEDKAIIQAGTFSVSLNDGDGEFVAQGDFRGGGFATFGGTGTDVLLDNGATKPILDFTSETAIYSATSTAITTLDCDTFDSRYQILTANTDIQWTNTPASGESFVKNLEVVSTATESLAFSTATKIIGSFVSDGTTVNLITVNFANYPTLGLIITVLITQ